MECNPELVDFLKELLAHAEAARIDEALVVLGAAQGIVTGGVYARGAMEPFLAALDDAAAKSRGEGRVLQSEAILEDGRRVNLLAQAARKFSSN